jgi:DNA-binding response OmpR family regulator
MSKTLIVQDDLALAKTLQQHLKSEGIESECSRTVIESWKKITTEHYDLILLDTTLSDGSGLELCRNIRESGNEVPIIFLSSNTDEASVVRAIKIGADDYVRKPFGIEELLARIKKLMKKMMPGPNLFRLGELTINLTKRSASVGKELLPLGKKEMEILTLLVRKAGDVVTRENILNTLYEDKDRYDRTIDSHISHLRKKLKNIQGESFKITSIYGVGYQLKSEKSPSPSPENIQE